MREWTMPSITEVTFTSTEYKGEVSENFDGPQWDELHQVWGDGFAKESTK